MDTVKAEFLRLCDEAIRETESTLSAFQSSGEHEVWIQLLTQLRKTLHLTREQAVKDMLPRPARGQLGLSKGISEWGLDDKGAFRLYDICRGVDNYYESHF